jgi:zinc protease
MTSLSRYAALAAATMMTLASGALVGQVSDYRDIKSPPLRAFSIPQPKRIQLDNGMVIFLEEDHELPLISGRATIRGGERDTPSDKAGIMDIYGDAWRTGGTTAKTGEQLDDFLEARGARVETTADDDSSVVTFDVLKEDFDAVFPIAVDLLRNPAFRQEKIDLARTQVTTGIARRNDDVGGVVQREAMKLGYGADSPYTRQAEYSTVSSVTRDDLVALHKRFVHPNDIIVGIVGDFDSARMEAKLREAFGSWPRGPQTPHVAPAVGTPARPGVYFIAKDDVTQANISAVTPSTLLRSDPDYYPALVLNEILSGGFSGRLMNHLRSQMGLTYGVNGGIQASWDHPGLFRAGLATKSSTTMQSIDALRSELGDLLTKPFTADELQHAKDSLLNAFVFTRDSRQKALNQAVLLEFYGYPADYYTRYPAMVQKVTADDVARVAKKYVHPDQVALLVVGNQKDFDKPVSSLGEFHTVDITIPEPGAAPRAAGPGGAGPAAATPAPPAGNAEGMALVRKVEDFVGGKAKVDGLVATHSAGSLSMKTPQGMMDMEIDSVEQYPGMQRRTMKMAMGEMTMVLGPDSAFVVAPMGVQDLPGSQRDAMTKEMRQDFIVILKNIDKPGYTFTADGTEKVNGVDARIVDISVEGSPLKWYVDPATGKLLRTASQARGGAQATDYTEWKSVGGLTLPSGFSMTVNGEAAGSGQMKTIEVNPTVDPALFRKPAAK